MGSVEEDPTLLCPLKTSNSQLNWNFRPWFGAFGQRGSRTRRFLLKRLHFEKSQGGFPQEPNNPNQVGEMGQSEAF